MIFRRFLPGHLETLIPQPRQARDHRWLIDIGDHITLAEYPSLSAWHEGACVACGGVVPVSRYKAVGWAVLSYRAAPYRLPLIRKAREVIAALPFKRVELQVAADHQAGVRFAQALGAIQETPLPLKYYGADGQDHYLFAVIKD